MNERKDYFEDIDKTADLLKAYKPREVDDTELESTTSLLEEYEKSLAEEQQLYGSTGQIEDAVKLFNRKEKRNNIENSKKNIKKKRKLKNGIPQLIFVFMSILFIIACLIFYGSRLYHYYKIYNPKNENGENLSLLSISLAKNSSIVYEGGGLYMLNGEYVFKGNEVNNYIKFSNMLWRIVKSNNDGTIDIVLDDSINSLMWNANITNYTKSDINDYLNNYFLKYLNKDMLSKVTICEDIVTDVKSFTCKKTNNNHYVRLLDISDFLNSKAADTDTYMVNTKSAIWLSSNSGKLVWHINGYNLSLAEASRNFQVKPVIKLKASTALKGGKGTKEEPYIVETQKTKLQVGDYIKLDEDKWTIYDIDEKTISLTRSTLLPKKLRFDIDNNMFDVKSKTSLAYFLNTSYYNILSYKDIILDEQWSIGNYINSYNDVSTKVIKAKIGLLSVKDLKFDNSLTNYYLLNGNDTGVYSYNTELILNNSSLFRYVRPAIKIKNMKIKNGKGTLENPYVLEV